MRQSGLGPASTGSNQKGQQPTLRILYLFAGKHRQTSLRSSLQTLAKQFNLEVILDEYDIEQNLNHDLTDDKLQAEIKNKIRAGWYHVVITTPPCSTFSRVRSANLKGPPPVRSRDHLWGFPWLFGKYKQEVLVGNSLVVFSVEVLEEVKLRPFSADIHGTPRRSWRGLQTRRQHLDGSCFHLVGQYRHTDFHKGLPSVLLGGSLAKTHTYFIQPATFEVLGFRRVA